MERRALEALMLQASITDPAHRNDILANPDVIAVTAEQIEGGEIIVADVDGDLAGFASLRLAAGRAADLDGLFAAPERQRRGVGRALVAYCAEKAGVFGCDRIEVVANPAARAFYLAVGFAPIGDAQTRFGPAVLMRREIPSGRSASAAIRRAAGSLASSETAMLDARVLAKTAFEIDDAAIIAHGDEGVAPARHERFAEMVARRATGEPIAYITGVREFWSLPIKVAPPVLIPRADSETLIAAALARRARTDSARVLDLGCGSGALLCAALASMPNATGLGIDVCEKAVALTRRNLEVLGLAGRGRAIQGDWTTEPVERSDIILSNPPYIVESARGTLPRDVEAFEDPRALFAGVDGMDAYRALAIRLPELAGPGALMILELGAGQEASVAALFRQAFPRAVIAAEPDLAGIARTLIIDLAKGAR